MTNKEVAESLNHAVFMYTSNKDEKWLQRVLYYSGLLAGQFL